MWLYQHALLAIRRQREGRICCTFKKMSKVKAHTAASPLPTSTPVKEEHFHPVRDQEDHCQDTLAALLKPHYSAQSPVILRQAVARQKAIIAWKDLQYLENQVGHDTPVEVEIGSSYNEGVLKSTIQFGDYLHYIRLFERMTPRNCSSHELVYMAQHAIFPLLYNDFTIPSLCFSKRYDGVGYGKLYSSLFWFGPSGCKSSLHYDPCDNLLMQFVGRKKVILYPPQPGIQLGRGAVHTNHDDWYYSGQNFGQQYNTSAVDVECPDLNKYPLFAQAPPAQVSVLYPGDILFIPKKWWHFLRAMDTSVSVNVWWR